MTDFGYIGEKKEGTDIIYRYNKFNEKEEDITDSILIKDSRYNDPAEQNRKVYIYVDILKSSKFKLKNDNSIFEEVRNKIESLQKDSKNLHTKINTNKDNISSIKSKQLSNSNNI